MIVLEDVTFEKISSRCRDRLLAEGINAYPGSIAKLITDIISEEIAEIYTILSNDMVMRFISTAEGEYLDSIGILLNCTRKDLETDESYRSRMSNQTLSLEKANDTAIRMAVLARDDVDDVILQRWSHGPGTFSVLIIPNSNSVSEEDTITGVSELLESVAAYGIKYHVTTPYRREIKCRVKIHMSEQTESEKMDTFLFIADAMKRKVNSLKAGEEFISSQLTKAILDVSKDISKAQFLEFRIDGKLCNYQDYNCRWNERFVISQEPEAITLF